jgi:hypothetical protein
MSDILRRARERVRLGGDLGYREEKGEVSLRSLTKPLLSDSRLASEKSLASHLKGASFSEDSDVPS